MTPQLEAVLPCILLVVAIVVTAGVAEIRERLAKRGEKADLHYTARLEREVYGEVVSVSLRDLPPPNPFVGARRREASLVIPMYVTDEMQRAQGAPSPTRAVRG